jgi:hypothetical protein
MNEVQKKKLIEIFFKKKKKFISMGINSILASLNKHRYISKEDYNFCKLYKYKNEYIFIYRLLR